MTLTTLRICALILGPLAIVIGCVLLWLHFRREFDHGFGAFSILGTGVYFLNYGITGRSTILVRKHNKPQ
jgi:hypothetical protein